MSLITIIGRGQSGTRAIAHTLLASGVYMGNRLNLSGDKVPPEAMYKACRLLAKHVKWNGGLSWDFSSLHTMRIDPKFQTLINSYLADVLNHSSEHKGWKIPETTLAYPWILRMFPDIKYIHWVRDPRDSIIGRHITDDLSKFGVRYPPTEDMRSRRAISCYYQYQIMKSTPRPKHVIVVRLEDFVLKQEETLKRLEEFLQIPLARILVRRGVVGRWKTDRGQRMFPFLQEVMLEHHYDDELRDSHRIGSSAPLTRHMYNDMTTMGDSIDLIHNGRNISFMIMRDIEGDMSIKTHDVSLNVKGGGLFKRRKSILISGSVNSEMARDKITRIATCHAGNNYDVINELSVKTD